MRNILLITDVFPPLAGAGVKRILKFIKFLPKLGWRCHILTAKNENFMPLDPTLSSEVPAETIVERTYTLESLFKRTQKRTDLQPSSTARLRRFSSPLKMAYRRLGPLLKVPDSRILWLPWAVRKGVSMCNTHEIKAILATGPSFTNFVVGSCVKKITGTPLLLDVRDAWVSDPTRSFQRNYLRELDARLERFSLHCADRVVTTNPYVTQDFIKRYPRNAPALFDTVFNGYDPDDFQHLEGRVTKNARFTIVHTGRLYAERTPKNFLKALWEALTARPDMRPRTRVLFVGSCETYNDGRQIEDYILEYNLKGVVETPGQVSRRKSLEFQADADLLLLLIGVVPPEQSLTYGISGKLFDYMGCGRPIITLANEGATRELILEKNIGAIFYHNQTHEVRDYLIDAFDRFLNADRTNISPPRDFPEFRLDRQVSCLATHLAAMVINS